MEKQNEPKECPVTCNMLLRHLNEHVYEMSGQTSAIMELLLTTDDKRFAAQEQRLSSIESIGYGLADAMETIEEMITLSLVG